MSIKSSALVGTYMTLAVGCKREKEDRNFATMHHVRCCYRASISIGCSKALPHDDIFIVADQSDDTFSTSHTLAAKVQVFLTSV